MAKYVDENCVLDLFLNDKKFQFYTIHFRRNKKNQPFSKELTSPTLTERKTEKLLEPRTVCSQLDHLETAVGKLQNKIKAVHSFGHRREPRH